MVNPTDHVELEPSSMQDCAKRSLDYSLKGSEKEAIFGQFVDLSSLSSPSLV
jgi:hypothetical protein